MEKELIDTENLSTIATQPRWVDIQLHNMMMELEGHSQGLEPLWSPSFIKDMIYPKEYHLFLDDYRQPIDCINYVHSFGIRPDVYTKRKWVVVKNYQEFITCIGERGLPKSVSFDHDLDDAHYGVTFEDWNNHTAEDLHMEETGMDVAKWLVAHCLDTESLLPEYFVHSMNPVGRQNIKALLDNYRAYEHKKYTELEAKYMPGLYDKNETDDKEN